MATRALSSSASSPHEPNQPSPGDPCLPTMASLDELLRELWSYGDSCIVPAGTRCKRPGWRNDSPGAAIGTRRATAASTAGHGAARERAEAAIALSTEHGFALWSAWGEILRGWAAERASRGEDNEFEWRIFRRLPRLGERLKREDAKDTNEAGQPTRTAIPCRSNPLTCLQRTQPSVFIMAAPRSLVRKFKNSLACGSAS